MQKMNKTFIEYVRTRVKEVVMCTNGKISTKMEKRKADIGMLEGTKIRQIRDGVAKLKSDDEIASLDVTYKRNGIPQLLPFFDYQMTNEQKGKIAFNARIKSAAEEMQTEVELAGKRLIDQVVLGLISVDALPDELENLAKMYDQMITEMEKVD